MTQSPRIWKATYEAETQEDLNDAYKQWACDYDRDTCEAMGYVGPSVAAAMLDRHLESADCRVLDAGCGTGLVGEVLIQMGYTKIDALDYSKEMLDEAEKKGIYRDHMRADLSKPLDIKDNRYDAVICVGTFTYGHVEANAFDELIRITKPNGLVCFTIREGAYKDYGYRKRMIDLERCDAWELISMVDADYLTKENVTCKLCTYRTYPGKPLPHCAVETGMHTTTMKGKNP